MYPPNCTLVTACFDLTKFNDNSRSLDDNINNMVSLLEVPCYLVIYTDSNCVEKIINIRGELNSLTHYIIMDFTELKFYKYIDLIKKNRNEYHPTKDKRTCAESHILCCNKFNFVLEIMDLNPFNTTKFGWIDANLGKNFSKICIKYENNMILDILNNITDKFHLQILNVCDKKYKNQEFKKEMYNQYRWIACGCLFTTGIEIGKKILNRLNEIFINTTELGYGHGEEMLYLEVLDELYDDIEKSYGDYKMILNNFIKPTTGFHYIYYFIIKKYNNYCYFKEAYDCCKKILFQIENFKVQIDYNIYFLTLFEFYFTTLKYKKNESKEIVNHIMKLINVNPLIKKEFEKNKEYYIAQFNYA